MSSEEFLRQYAWVLAAVAALLFVLSRYLLRHIRRRQEARDQAAADGDTPLVGPEGFRRARRQFLLTAALLIVIVILSVLTHFQ